MTRQAFRQATGGHYTWPARGATLAWCVAVTHPRGVTMHRSAGNSSSLPAFAAFDAAREAQRIVAELRGYCEQTRPRRGLVVPMSGDIESALCAALAARALGPDAVFGLMLPERESSSAALLVAVRWAEHLGIDYDVQDITSVLEVVGCYRKRDEIVRRVAPELRAGWTGRRVRVLDPGDVARPARFALRAVHPDGHERDVPLADGEYRAIVAAAAMKQRTRAMLAYYHADRLAYAVLGTAGRLEYALGLMAKAGDAAADVMPIAHLAWAEVIELARHVGVPPAVPDRAVGGAVQLQADWIDWQLSLPRESMDRVLGAREHGYDARAAAPLLGLPVDQVERAFGEIERGCATAVYVLQPPRLVEHLASTPVTDMDIS